MPKRPPTTEGATDDRPQLRRLRAGRRVGLTALWLVVLAGAATLLGVRTGDVTARAAGWEVTVTYPVVARPGLAVQWAVQVRSPGGFDGPIRVATSSDYLAIFDENGLDPDPAAATADGEETFWEFDPPGSDTLVVSFDARIEPGVQWSKAGRTRVTDATGATMVAVDYRTWVMP